MRSYQEDEYQLEASIKIAVQSEDGTYQSQLEVHVALLQLVGVGLESHPGLLGIIDQ